MSTFGNKDQIDLIQHTQDNLAAMQKNNDLLANILAQLVEITQPAEEVVLSDEEKRKAAYALNLCTVSVSQIIDYNDVNFLEHEYEAILNNLNLEQMPKDESLLHILKQLLDVITYFRIQEGEKKLLEKEYQQKMKNAIWNAVPNIGLIVAGGNPVTMAISLASQVGIGYMNYRKEKAKIGLEQERKEWELQRSAMEQFNGLRRELFDTAWRLAEKYKFPDAYRLTERQITQFNHILMDSDDLRRYERLKYIEDNFKAYPPFWYYLGNAANAVCQNSDVYGEQICSDYKKLAKEAFNKFLKSTEQNLLREDQLEASCALELFDLLDESESSRKVEYLERAQRASGNAFDVLELCAMSYWKIGETEKAADLFRMLVNEEYNTLVNAQLLSRIYVSQVIENHSTESRKQYQTLKVRVGGENLFPMPPVNADSRYLGTNFLSTQKDNLREKYISVLTEFIYKYARKYDALCQKDGNISNDMISLLEQICMTTKKLFPDDRCFILPLQNAIRNRRNEFQAMLAYDKKGHQRAPMISFIDIIKDPIEKLADCIFDRIEAIDSMNLVSEAECDLDLFCIENSLQINSPAQTRNLAVQSNNSIANAIYDDKFEHQQNLSNRIEHCVRIITDITRETSPVRTNEKKPDVYFCIKGDHYHDTYLKKHEKCLLKYFSSVSVITAIINDRSWKDQDLIFSSTGVTLLEAKKGKGFIYYRDVAQYYAHDGLNFGKSTFKNPSVDMRVLRKLTDALASIQGQYQDAPEKNGIETINQIIQQRIQKKDTRNVYKEYYNFTQSKAKKPTIKKGNIDIVQTHSNNSTTLVIEGNVTVGPLFIGSHCTIDGSGYYEVEKIGNGSSSLPQISEGKYTQFTLRKFVP